MKQYRNTWFTLVELLVVITILTILATIAFVYIESSIAEARDAWRNSDINEIVNVLELYSTEKWFFPEPSDRVDITYSWSAVAWSQWTFGPSVWKIVKAFWSEVPVDPLNKNPYTYSITAKANEFQIWAIKETFEEEEGLWEIALNSLIPEAEAASIQTAFVRGDYNWFMVKANLSGTDYYIATPSIIATDISDSDVVSIITNQNLVYDEFFNLPHSYSDYMAVDGGFNFNVTDPIVYSWSSSGLKSESELLLFNEKLKYIYATTPTESFDRYLSILDRDGLTGLKGFLTRKFKIQFRTYFNCKDILDDGLDEWSKFYEIDPDGPLWEDPYDVYCDMETDGGWWTRVWGNYVENWNFSWGTGAVDAYEFPGEANEIVALSSPVEGNEYALHQTGNYSSYYKVNFPDTWVLKPGYEVRMTLWRSDYGSWSVFSSEENETTILWGKSNPWTIGTCTNNSSWPWCQFVGFNKKMANSANFWPGWALTEIDFSVTDPVSTITTQYLDGWILFDGFTPSSWTDGYGTSTYSNSEKQAIDDWVQAGWFLIATNDENDYDPLGEYYNLETEEYNTSWDVVSSGTNGERWIVENINHPIVNGSIWLWVDLRWQFLVGPYRKSALSGYVWPEDVVLAREARFPNKPTAILRKHGKGNILITSGDGIFKDMADSNTFNAGDLETVFAAAIMAYAIETAAWINPHEWYVFHNRIFYNDGTFSTNGEDKIIETITVDDAGTPRIWTKELTRHKIYKTPESFDWYIWLDANNNKDLYFTWLELELYYR